jgi:hypothetical protein
MGGRKLRYILQGDTGRISRLTEKEARIGRFHTLLSERVGDKVPEELRLTITIEDCLCHEIALREDTDNGPHLIFPSQCQEIYAFLRVTSTSPHTIRTMPSTLLRSGFARAGGGWKACVIEEAIAALRMCLTGGSYWMSGRSSAVTSWRSCP